MYAFAAMSAIGLLKLHSLQQYLHFDMNMSRNLELCGSGSVGKSSNSTVLSRAILNEGP